MLARAVHSLYLCRKGVALTIWPILDFWLSLGDMTRVSSESLIDDCLDSRVVSFKKRALIGGIFDRILLL